MLKIRLKNTYFILVFLSFHSLISCQTKKNDISSKKIAENAVISSKKILPIKPAAQQTSDYLGALKDKNIAVVANQTSVIFKNNDNDSYTHIVDSLLSLDIHIAKVFAPEHGFRGKADAGEHILDQKDKKTGLPIFSLYGKNKKPSKELLQGVDFVLFDIQDVGVRFYTYISTLHYVMEACAENGIPVMVLDRPNPNRHIVDGPMLDKALTSFVGMHPVPTIYGLTIGEYALMINGEKWLKNGIQCDLTVIPLKNYNNASRYDLPIKPSPNLPNAQSINLYPSLCLFEGTVISCGRGTAQQFQLYGSPDLPKNNFPFSFTPQPNFGSKNPKHKGKICYGEDLTKHPQMSKFDITWIKKAYDNSPDKTLFFNDFFDKLAGTYSLKKQLIQGISTQEIEATWKEDLVIFNKTRSKYTLYTK
ncbi:MAG: hypothetical protein COB81_07210 [Flavobacteriaceae bacterium]|nr:MAG: hypothetical protein COB81_07210 [Flavobacteriaceae bacterium]